MTATSSSISKLKESTTFNMNSLEWCKTKPFPNSYFICINCFEVLHRSCVLQDKTKYTFVDGYKIEYCKNLDRVEIIMHEQSIIEQTISEQSEDTLLREQHLSKLIQDHRMFIEEVTVRGGNAFIKNQEKKLRKANYEIENLRHDIFNLQRKSTSTKTT